MVRSSMPPPPKKKKEKEKDGIDLELMIFWELLI